MKKTCNLVIRYIIIFTVISLIFLISNSFPNGEDKMISSSMGLEIDLKLYKEHFYLNENIRGKVTFTNKTNNDLFINTAFNLYMEETKLIFEIIMPDGKKPVETIPLIGKRPQLNKKDFLKIKKNNHYSTDIIISRWYRLDKPGDYYILAHYYNRNNGKQFKLNAWTGSVSSNKVKFTIDKEAYSR